MSQQAVADFMTKVSENESLQKEFDSVLDHNEGMSVNQALADLGVNHGYEITAEDMEKLRLALKAQKGESDELSEDELETVAGGLWGSFVTGIVASLSANKIQSWIDKW